MSKDAIDRAAEEPDNQPQAVALPEENYFEVLAQIAPETDKKARLTYVSWAEAWNRLKRVFPDANFFVHTREVPIIVDGELVAYEESYPFSDPIVTGGFVRVTVEVNGIAHTVPLPIMDQRNNSVPVDRIDSMAVNKAIWRALTKGIALHGLGLHVYKGEDLPEDTSQTQQVAPARPAAKKADPAMQRVRTAAQGKDRAEVKKLYDQFGAGKPGADIDGLVAAIEKLPAA